ncbi:MAG: histidine kinase [Saprospirales bacterium]|nr:histidine kinase [Saprospirales bacterium]
MSTLVGQFIRSRIFSVLSQRIVYHTLFWALFLVAATSLDAYTSGVTFRQSLDNQYINVIIYAGVVYMNIFYLIPNYLAQKRFLTYFGLFILIVLTVTPIKVVIYYFKFSHIPNAQEELVNQMNFYFIPTFLIATSSTLIKIVIDRVRHLREMQELETQTMQSELRFLKSQINPHFLFNTLNNLYALTLKKSDLAPEIVLKLSEMMRYMLYECNEKQVLLSKEVNYLQNHLDLEALRQGSNVEVTFEVNGQISDQKIAPLMFIPFLENSFKHGLSHHISQGYIKIQLDVKDQTVRLFIENSKPESLPLPDHSRRSGGIGLVNVRRRLDLLYPGKYELRLNDAPRTYAIELTLNLDS